MEQPANDQIRTALYPYHRALGAKFVNFSGWEMPLQYQGIIPEHHAVRNHVGIFDVSHMGRIIVTGPEAHSFVNYLATNDIPNDDSFSATYTTLCDSQGGCVDDVIIYRQAKDHFFIIANASNREKDFQHFKNFEKQFRVQVENRFEEEGILAIQGPMADNLIQQIFPKSASIKPMHFLPTTFKNTPIILSHTGYTGAGGFEIYAPNSIIIELWNLFLDLGKPYGMMPIGLGARDTLRLEMGYALYGHELSEEISPIESVAAWTVKMDKPSFLGKESLKALASSRKKRFQYGIILTQEGIARKDYPVKLSDSLIGTVTSGSFSPTLNKSIAIILVNRKLSKGECVEVQIRQKSVLAEVVKMPFTKALWYNSPLSQ